MNNFNKYFYHFKTKIGWITIGANDDDVTLITFNKIKINNSIEDYNTIMNNTFQQLEEYLEGKRKNFNIPFKYKATNLENKILKKIIEIPYGKTYTYQEIAMAIGNKNYARIVGNVCKKNSILIVIPCHRVVAKNGKCNYVAGSKIKNQLLYLEKNN